EKRLERLRYVAGARLVGLEAGRALHRVVPVLAPDAVGFPGTGGPAQHSLAEADADRRAESLEGPSRVPQYVLRVQHRWRCSQAFADQPENFHLLRQAGVPKGRWAHFRGER